MNCEAVKNLSIAHLDGTIDPGKKREIEDHLTACVACREHDRQLREVWEILDESPVLHPSPGFDAAVRSRIAQEPHRWRAWGWLAAPSPLLAMGIAALLVFSIWLSSLPRVAQPSPRATGTVETEFMLMAVLPGLEDYDGRANFEALSELPVQPAAGRLPGM
jgi:predicted anti-sigma-YlaC factor YlaD